MPRCSLYVEIKVGTNTYMNASHCRETLLFYRCSQEKALGKFSGMAGEMSLGKAYLSLSTMHRGAELVKKYYPDFEYFVGEKKVVIPDQEFSALEGHAILGALRDGPGMAEEFFLYVVQTLQDRKTLNDDHSYNGPSTWATDKFSIKTLWEVCQEFRRIREVPSDSKPNPLVRSYFKSYFLSPDTLVESTKEATKCTSCGKKDSFRLFFYKASPSIGSRAKLGEMEKPWLSNGRSVSFKHRAVDDTDYHTPLSVDRYSGTRIEGGVYSTVEVYALGRMFMEGGV